MKVCGKCFYYQKNPLSSEYGQCMAPLPNWVVYPPSFDKMENTVPANFAGANECACFRLQNEVSPTQSEAE